MVRGGRKALKNVQIVGQTIFSKILVFTFEKYYTHMLLHLFLKGFSKKYILDLEYGIHKF